MLLSPIPQMMMQETGLHCQVDQHSGDKHPVMASLLVGGNGMDSNHNQWSMPGQPMMSPTQQPTMAPHPQGALKMEACARSNGILRLRPADIRYSKKRIELSFHPDYEVERKVISFETTLKRILNDSLSPDDIPLIEVMQVQDGKSMENWVLNGNKRLYLYKKLEKYGLIHEIPVQIIPFDQNIYHDKKIFSTLNRGTSIGIQLRASEFAFDRRLDVLCQRSRRLANTDFLSFQALRS